MDTNLKILIASPTYEGMAYCFTDFIKHLKEIDYFNFDILIVDNSRSKSFFRKIKKIPGVKFIYDETNEEENMKRLISSRNKILDYAIKKDYDCLLMMDCDVMVRKDFLANLLKARKDVVSGLYFNYLNLGGKLELVPIAHAFITEKEFQSLKETNQLPPEAKSKEDIKRHLNDLEIRTKEILEVKFPSGGCVLLSKKAFGSGAKYNLEEMPEGIPTSDDVYFFNRLRELGFKLYCYPSMLCSHAIKGKYGKGREHFLK